MSSLENLDRCWLQERKDCAKIYQIDLISEKSRKILERETLVMYTSATTTLASYDLHFSQQFTVNLQQT